MTPLTMNPRSAVHRFGSSTTLDGEVRHTRLTWRGASLAAPVSPEIGMSCRVVEIQN